MLSCLLLPLDGALPSKIVAGVVVLIVERHTEYSSF